MPRSVRGLARRVRHVARSVCTLVLSLWPVAFARKYATLFRNRCRAHRKLQIGPGSRRLPGFETLDIVPGPAVDYMHDAAKRLPFRDATFELVYASHVLEHIPWYQSQDVIREWVRILEPGGTLEVWVPDGVKICRTLVDYEVHGKDRTALDGWYRFNNERDPCKWAAGRLFSYGDGTGNPCSPNWHRAIFTRRYLRALFEQAGLRDVREMDGSEVRGADHGWINLGMKGIKP